jgi:acyl-CoA thioesterase-1
MQMPPNYGEAFTRQFAAVYPEVAQRTDTPLMPFLLDGVAGNPVLNQADGIHPNARAQPLLLDNVWVQLTPLLRGG